MIQRAGELFGWPVSLVHSLSKAARPGTVLLAEQAARELPAARRGRLRRRALPHPAFAEQRVATAHPA